MTKKLENLFNLPTGEAKNQEEENNIQPDTEVNSDDSQNSIEQHQLMLAQVDGAIDKIDAALPFVDSLDTSDTELDELSQLARDKFEDLVDLGINVEARYSGTILQTAASLLGHAITAKQAKIDRKLKTVDLQLKKMRLDQQSGGNNNGILDAQDGKGVVMDRNEVLKQLLNKNNDS